MIRFEFAEMEEEIDVFWRIAKDYLDDSAETVLKNLKTSLNSIRTAARGNRFLWEIPETYPLRTNPTRAYEGKNRRGTHEVFASLDFVWAMSPLGPNGPKAISKRKFEMAGIASTRVRLYERLVDGGKRELAMWRVEIGDKQSPGCHFHVQIQGEDAALPFPKSLSVPRLPSVLISPLAVAKYLLGELFQKDWEDEALRQSPEMNEWNEIQRVRFTGLLGWQNELLRIRKGSPWIVLKSAQPTHDIFLRAR